MNNIYDLMNDISPDASITDRCILTGDEAIDILDYIKSREICETKKIAIGKDRRFKRNRSFGRHAAAAAAIIIGISAAAGGIAYAAIKWNQALTDSMQITSKQQIELTEEGIASDVGLTSTSGDVTISVDQCLVDDYFAFVSLSVSGYDLEEGKEPFFDSIMFDIEGNEDWSGSGGFLDGVSRDSGGTPISETETPYVYDDGTLKYIYIIQGTSEGSLIGKNVHATINGLGTVYKTVYTPVIEGTWELDWTFSGASASTHYDLDETLGDSGATVTGADISPISVVLDYNFPAEEIAEEATDGDGNTTEVTTYAEPPYFTGFRLKDGTLLTGLGNGGSEGYTDDELTEYKTILALGEVVDPEEIDSLLFIKSYPEGEEEISEENLYIVPIG